MIIGDTIVAQARSWLGTRFHHQGRVKGVGCDCIGLVVGVALELGLMSRQGLALAGFDELHYPRLPDGVRLQGVLREHLHALQDEARPGDVLLFRFDTNPQHVGIRSDIGVIHCYAEARKVVEHRLDTVWRERLVAAYRFDGVAEKL